MGTDRAGSMRFSDPEAPRWQHDDGVWWHEYRGRRLGVYLERLPGGRSVWRWMMDGERSPDELGSMERAQKAAKAGAKRGRVALRFRKAG